MNKDTAINMDLSQSICVYPEDQSYIGSRADGVARIHLEREFAESGHTTSIVKFDKGSYFPAHTHHNGEEIYVLEGVFSDESGNYPKGSYIRNPPGSKHKPHSEQGCVIFVKLEQFKAGDDKQFSIKPDQYNWQQGIGNLKVLSLHEYGTESSALVFWPKGEKFQPHSHWGGEEILVLEGKLIDEHNTYPQGTWIRNKHMSEHHPYVEEDTLILVKTGHLK